MKKLILNKKGFAITSILYALILLLALILFLLVSLQSFERSSTDDFADQETEKLNSCVLDGSC